MNPARRKSAVLWAMTVVALAVLVEWVVCRLKCRKPRRCRNSHLNRLRSNLLLI